MVVSWLLFGRVLSVGAETRTDAFVALGTGVLLAVLAGWYLYGSESVRRYYASLATQQTSASADAT